jgi:hypothetical protein
MLWISCLLIVGCFGWFIAAAAGSGLPFGHEELIHARVPWLVLGVLWLGAALGLTALATRRRISTAVIVAVQAPLVGLFSFYFLQGSFLPDHSVALSVGEAFPSYSLLDQDETMRSASVGEAREPALYVFYRGDW